MLKKLFFSALTLITLALIRFWCASAMILYRKQIMREMQRREEEDSARVAAVQAKMSAFRATVLPYRIAIGRSVSFRHYDGRSWQYQIADVEPRGIHGVRVTLTGPEGVFNGLPILLFDGYTGWEVWLKGDEDITHVDAQFDWENEWRQETMPALPPMEELTVN